MGRRKRKQSNQNVLGIFLILACTWIVLSAIHSFPGGLGGIVLFLLVDAGTLFIGSRILRKRRRGRLLMKANAIVERQLDQLVKRRAQLVREDAYGKPILADWVKETQYFITNHIQPSLTNKEQSLLLRERFEIARIIDKRIEIVMQNGPTFKAVSENMSPAEFEHFCAEQLRLSGWSARVTRQSRDQGIDIVAEQNGVRVILQCKLYSGPVGNKAVQEAAAGKAHEQAHYGAVVTNNRFTAAAEQLASTNGILLLHYTDLANLQALLRTASPSYIGYSVA